MKTCCCIFQPFSVDTHHLPSEDSDTIKEFGKSCQPKLDIDVAKRFLRGIIEQANEDNLKLSKGKLDLSFFFLIDSNYILTIFFPRETFTCYECFFISGI